MKKVIKLVDYGGKIHVRKEVYNSTASCTSYSQNYEQKNSYNIAT